MTLCYSLILLICSGVCIFSRRFTKCSICSSVTYGLKRFGLSFSCDSEEVTATGFL